MGIYLDRIVSKLGFSSYEAYLRSDHWKEFSKWVRKEKCFCCGYSSKLQVHHTHYDSIGSEVPEDVVTVCDKCHKSIHELAGCGTPLSKCHITHRKSIQSTSKYKNSKENRNRWVDWKEMRNKAKKQTLADLKEFLIHHKLWSEEGITPLAKKLKMVKFIDGWCKYHLARYIKFMQRCKKDAKRTAAGKSVHKHGKS